MQCEIVTTEIFDQWLSKLNDQQAISAIGKRLLRAEAVNLGDVEPVGDGVSEMRIFVGKGYPVYFSIRGGTLVSLLNGGCKGTQAQDIKLAKTINKRVEV